MSWILIVLFFFEHSSGSSRASVTVEFKDFNECTDAAAAIRRTQHAATWCVKRTP